MRAFVFCFFLLVFACPSFGQSHESDTLQSFQPKTDTINYSPSKNLHHKLNPIHYSIDNYQYNGISNVDRAVANTLAVSAEIALSFFDVYDIFGGTFLSLRRGKSQQEKILSKVHQSIKKGNYDQARQTLKKNIGVLENPTGKMGVGYHYNVATLYKYVGMYDTALRICQKGIGVLHEQLPNDGRKTSKFYDAIEGETRIPQKNHYLASSYNLSGEIRHISDNYEDAIKLYEKALVIWSEFYGCDSDAIMAYNNIGNAHYAMGNYDEALKYSDIAYQMSISNRKPLLRSEIYDNKANVLYSMGDYEKALELYWKSIRTSNTGTKKGNPFRVRAYVGASNTYYELGNYEKALELQQIAIRILEQKFGEIHQHTAQSYSKIGAIYYSLGDHKKALKYQKKAMRILSISPQSNDLQRAAVFNNLAITKLVVGEHEEAVAYQERALSIVEEKLGGSHLETIRYKLNLAEIYKELGSYSLADSLYRIIIPQTIEHQNKSYLSLPDEQRLKYLNTVENIYANFYSFVLNSRREDIGQSAAALLINTKSLALDYSITFREIIGQIDDEKLTELSEKLNKLNRQVIRAEMSISGILKNKRTLPILRSERDEVIAQMLRNQTLKTKLKRDFISWEPLQNQLNQNEAILDFLLIDEGLKKSYCAILIRESGTPLIIPLTDEIDINSVVNKKNYIGDLHLRKQLYTELWQPLEAHLKNVTTIYLSPSGALHKIPFEALQNEKRQFLSERFQFHYYSSMRDFVKAEPQQKPYNSAVIMGHILYDLKDSLEYQALTMRTLRDKVTPLEGTLEEVNQIDSICHQTNLKTTLLTIDKATEEVVQSLTGANSPNIYHFATHGVFLNPMDTLSSESYFRKRLRLSNNPLKHSALMLYGANHTWVKGRPIFGSGEDGILTALEVTALDLQNTDLVVLSACSTGLGDVHNTEGVFGLQRAFKLAGVNHVVASLWDVDDVATKDLMVKFYKNLLEEKQDPATALRNAKDYFRDKGYEPADWAGFILIE